MSLGHKPSPYIVNSTPEITSPHNSPSKSCFSTHQEERRILISSSHPPYDLVSFSWVPRTPFYLPKARLWCFSTQSAPLFNFDDSLVPHIQRQDGNLMVKGFSWYTSGKSPARNFRAAINNLSNQLGVCKTLLEPTQPTDADETAPCLGPTTRAEVGVRRSWIFPTPVRWCSWNWFPKIESSPNWSVIYIYIYIYIFLIL